MTRWCQLVAGAVLVAALVAFTAERVEDPEAGFTPSTAGEPVPVELEP